MNQQAVVELNQDGNDPEKPHDDHKAGLFNRSSDRVTGEWTRTILQARREQFDDEWAHLVGEQKAEFGVLSDRPQQWEREETNHNITLNM